jgi:membrane protease YdiL (CAAX protease family)
LIERLKTPEPPPPWGISQAVTALVVGFVALIGGALLALVFFPMQTFTTLAGWTVGALLLANYISATRKAPADREAMRLGSPTTPIFFVMFITLGFALVFDLLGLAVTGTFLASPELSSLGVTVPGIVDWIFAVAFMVLAQPAAEELVFRGVVLPVLRIRLGAWLGLIINAGLFAVFHAALYTPGGEVFPPNVTLWYSLALPFLGGLLLAAIRVYTGSTRAAIFAHATLGLFAIVKLLVMSG